MPVMAKPLRLDFNPKAPKIKLSGINKITNNSKIKPGEVRLREIMIVILLTPNKNETKANFSFITPFYQKTAQRNRRKSGLPLLDTFRTFDWVGIREELNKLNLV